MKKLGGADALVRPRAASSRALTRGRADEGVRPSCLLLLLFCTACSFFSKTKNDIYSLDRIAPAAVTTARGTPIAIESVELPPGFDRREIVVRQAGHQLDVRSNQLWAASLQDLILHTLAFDLAARLPEGMVVLPGAIKPAATRTIDVVIEDIAAGPEPRVVLDAHWITAGASHREHITIDIPSLESNNIATGMSQAIAALGDRIASGLTASGAELAPGPAQEETGRVITWILKSRSGAAGASS
jgi:uncharacterized lipoprotein YmbA